MVAYFQLHFFLKMATRLSSDFKSPQLHFGSQYSSVAALSGAGMRMTQKTLTYPLKLISVTFKLPGCFLLPASITQNDPKDND